MITVKQLSFGYTRRRNIFDSLSLELPKGSIVGLLGRNGEGKTTLLKLLYGQLLRRQGELKVLDSDPKHRAVSFLQQVYLLPEEFRVPPISIRSFFDISAPFYPNYDEAVAKELIDIFGLQWDMNLKKISQGQKKKALIAFALSLRVPLLLLDEPTNGLDIPSKGVPPYRSPLHHGRADDHHQHAPSERPRAADRPCTHHGARIYLLQCHSSRYHRATKLQTNHSRAGKQGSL